MNESKNKTKHERKPVPLVAASAPAAAGQYFWNHFSQSLSLTSHRLYKGVDSHTRTHAQSHKLLQVAAAAAAKASMLASNHQLFAVTGSGFCIITCNIFFAWHRCCCCCRKWPPSLSSSLSSLSPAAISRRPSWVRRPRRSSGHAPCAANTSNCCGCLSW